MQKMILIGNIGADLSLQETASGVSMLRFSVAVKRDYTRGDGERQTDWFDSVAYRGVAESIAKYCKKGDKVYLEGRIETRSYEDNQGIKRKAIDFLVDKTEFLSVKKERSEEEGTEADDRQPARRKKATLQDMDDSELIPF